MYVLTFGMDVFDESGTATREALQVELPAWCCGPIRTVGRVALLVHPTVIENQVIVTGG